MAKKEIKIAGAGLAGLTAAINLAKAGFKVTVFEKSSKVGAHHPGDFEGFENWTTREDVLKSLQKMGVKITFPLWRTYSGSFYAPDLKTVCRFSDPKPIYYLIKRGSSKDCLDYHLYQQAQKAGANIVFKKSVKPEEVNIIATGASRPRPTATFSGCTFRTNKKKECSLGILNDDLSPKAYTYLLIRNGYGTLGLGAIGILSNPKERLNQALRTFQKLLKFEIREEKLFGGLHDFKLPHSAILQGKIYCGEAAGFQDFLAGFGMRYAITSGYLAAKSIIEGKDYDSLWKEQFLGQFKVGLVNRFLQESIGNRGYKGIIWYLNRHKNNVCSALYKQYNSRWYKTLLYPLARVVKRRFIE